MGSESKWNRNDVMAALNELVEQADGMLDLLTGAFEIQNDSELSPLVDTASAAIAKAKSVLKGY